MKETRIYEKKLDINTRNTQAFYNQRAKQLESMECPYTAVLLGDQNPKHAEQWNVYEKEFILPQLQVNETSRVLDIGCGMGRWAESVIPLAGKYFGADFSEEMVQVARRRCKFPGKDYRFYHASFQEVAKLPEDFFEERFNRVIIGGVCMYINDGDMKDCIAGLLRLVDEHCTMYLTETVAVEKRLTLDECPSAALKTTYDVIYRTPSEYNEYYKMLQEAGFRIVQQDYLPHLNNEKEYSETDRWYTILER